MLQCLTDLQRKIDSGHGTKKPEGIKSSTRRIPRSSSGSSNLEESIGDSCSSSCKRKRTGHHRDCSRDEFKKDKPPTFDGEIKIGKEG